MNRPDSEDAPRNAVDPDDASPAGSGGPDPGVAWMRNLQAGDEGSFDRLVAHYQSGVFHFIRASIKDEGRAEDLTQDVFIRVYRSRQKYRPTARFKTWLFTIANRLMLNEIRAIRRRRRVFSDVPVQRSPADTPDEGEFWGSVSDANAEDPGDFAERRELEDVVKALVATLPRNQRAAIELQRSERFSYLEISEILGVSPMAVKSLLVRAREKLKLGLEPYLSERRSTDGVSSTPSSQDPPSSARKSHHEQRKS